MAFPIEEKMKIILNRYVKQNDTRYDKYLFFFYKFLFSFIIKKPKFDFSFIFKFHI